MTSNNSKIKKATGCTIHFTMGSVANRMWAVFRTSKEDDLMYDDETTIELITVLHNG